MPTYTNRRRSLWNRLSHECRKAPSSCSTSWTIRFGQVRPWRLSMPSGCATYGCAAWTGIPILLSQSSNSADVELQVMRNIPFFNYPALFTAHEAEFQAILSDIGGRGAFIKQKDLEEFEKCLASFLGLSHSL